MRLFFIQRSVEDSEIDDWNDVINVNLRAPFFLSKGLSKKLSIMMALL